MQKEFTEAVRQKQELEDEVRSLTEDLIAVAADADSARMELSEARTAVVSLQQKCDEYEKERDAMNKHLVYLEAQVHEKASSDETFLTEVNGSSCVKFLVLIFSSR